MKRMTTTQDSSHAPSPSRAWSAYAFGILAIVGVTLSVSVWQLMAGGGFLKHLFGPSAPGDIAGASVVGLAILAAGMVIAHSNVVVARERARERRKWAEDVAEVQGAEDVRWASAFAAEIGVDLSDAFEESSDVDASGLRRAAVSEADERRPTSS